MVATGAYPIRFLGLITILAVSACGGGSGGGTGPSSPPQFLYASVYAPEHDGIYAIGLDASGALIPPPSEYQFGSAAIAIAVTRESRFLYASDISDGNLIPFQINSDGSLTPLWAEAVPGPFIDLFLASPTADFLFGVTSYGYDTPTVTSLAIDPATGAIKVLSSVQLAPVIQAASAVITPDGRFVYVYAGSYVTGLSVNALTGALSPIPQSPLLLTDAQGYAFYGAIVADPSSKFIYAVNQHTVLTIAIDAASGELNALPGGPSFDLGGAVTEVAASGKFLIADVQASAHCYLDSIDPATGLLSSVDGTPGGFFCGQLVANQNGPQVYVTEGDGDGGVFAYVVDPDNGTLEMLAGVELPSSGLSPTLSAGLPAPLPD